MQAIAIDPIPQVLTANEKRVKALFDEGKTLFQIALRLHMGMPAVRDIIFEIRKKEAISMAGKSKLSDFDRMDIAEKYKGGATLADLAAQYYVSEQTIANALKAAGVAARKGGRKKKTGINEDFEAAVESMIAENPSADAEPEEAIAEPVVETVPKVIWNACDDKIDMINLDIETREARIAELKEEIDKLVIEREQIRAWMEAHA